MQDIHNNVGLNIFHGISPSAHVEIKFKPQCVKKFHDNGFIYKSFGSNENPAKSTSRNYLLAQIPSLKLHL